MPLRFLIASGPTQEPLDPVRYLTNYSTGTMGRWLADEAKKKGHKVVWVDCSKNPCSAQELESELLKALPKCDVLLMAAAVCDVRPAKFSPLKIKKGQLSSLRLVKNSDILARLARRKKKNQIFIGFGLESEKIVANGLKKLHSKNLELIVLQRVTKKSAPFGEKPVDVILLENERKRMGLRGISKRELAKILVGEAERLFSQKVRDAQNAF